MSTLRVPHPENTTGSRVRVNMPQDIIYQDPDKPQPQSKGQTAKRTKFLPTLKVIGLQRSAYVDTKSQWSVRIFFIVVAFAFIGLGIWLTIHGTNRDLRDFLIIGPGTLGIGVILIIFILFGAIRDWLVFNKVSSIKVRVTELDGDNSAVARQRANSTAMVPATSSMALTRNSITMLTTGNTTRVPGNSLSGTNQGTVSPSGPVLSEEGPSNEPRAPSLTDPLDTMQDGAAESTPYSNSSPENVISTSM